MYPLQVEVNEKHIDKLKITFKQAYKDIVGEIEGATNFGVANRKAILGQIEAILTDLGEDVDGFINEEIPGYYETGADDAVKQLHNTGAPVHVAEGFNRIHKDAISALVSETATAFGESLTGVNRSAQLLLGRINRELITQQIAKGIIGGEARNQVNKIIVGTLRQQGLSALIDKGGKRWELDTYADMLFRTKAVEARNMGLAMRTVENGYDLVQVSAHSSEHEACAVWEGKILSLTGATQGYKTVEDAKSAGLFHPNCKHAINIVVPDLAVLTQSYNPKADTLTRQQLEALQKAQKEITDQTLTVYRGTGGKNPFTGGKSYGTGTYYSLDKGYAEKFGTVQEANLTFKNPLVVRNLDELEDYTKQMIQAGEEDFAKWARKKGFDGIIDKQTDVVVKLYR